MKDVRLDDGATVARHPSLGWRTPLRGLRSLGGDVLTAMLPAACVVCAGPLPVFGRVPVCEPCWDGMQPLQRTAGETSLLCSRCGDGLGFESRSFEASAGVHLCAHCRATKPVYRRAAAYGGFDRELRALLRGLKYDGMAELASGRLGTWMAAAASRLREDFSGEAVVIPVPLGERRRRERGYNQTELLAQAMCKEMARRVPEWTLRYRADLLVRTRETSALYGLTPEQRRERLRGVFRVPAERKDKVAGCDVLLVDDIMTTGATAESCAAVLRRAGARQVCVVTLARTMRADTVMPANLSRMAMAHAHRRGVVRS